LKEENKKKMIKNDPSQPKLTYQTHNSSHAWDRDYSIESKLWNSISNQFSVEIWNWKKIWYKKTLKRPESIHQTYNLSNEIRITSYKANRNKWRSLIVNQLNVEWWNWKKKNQLEKGKKTQVHRINSSNSQFGSWN
jgi:hypothetical protein